MSILLKHQPRANGIVKNGLVLYLDGKDFSNSPPMSTWRDRSQGSQYTYTNLITNGDFSNGTTGWSTNASTISCVNNTITQIGNGTNPTTDIIQTTNTACATGKVIYVRASCRVTNNSCSYISPRIVGSTGGTSIPVVIQNNPIQNNWYLLSGKVTLDATLTGNVRLFLRQAYADASSSNGKAMDVQNVLVVDLTALFGTNNEPSLSWCDANLGFVPNTPITSMTTDFTGKISGSVVENSNISKYTGASTLNKPTDSWSGEVGSSGTTYSQIASTDGTTCRIMVSTASSIAQQLFSFNLIADIEKQYGKPIPTTDGSVASKVAWLKANITSVMASWYGYGVGPLGNKAYLTYWNNSAWNLSGVQNHSSASPSLLSQSNSSFVPTMIQSDGTLNYLAYADAARTTDSTLLVMTNHGLISVNDLVENTTRGMVKFATVTTTNVVTTGTITGQAAGDIINKYHYTKFITAESGTNDTTLKSTNHGLSTGDFINNNSFPGLVKVTVVDANTLTLSTPITGQTAGNGLSLFHYFGQQTAESTVISSTIYTDYVNLQVNFNANVSLEQGIVSRSNDATASNFNYVSSLPASVTTDFVGKVSGSVVENPNIAKRTTTNNTETTLKVPSAFGTEWDNTQYALISTINNQSFASVTNIANAIPQQLFQFDLIKDIEKAYGKPIPTSDGTVASKVNWAKVNISSLTATWTGYGSGALGNKAYFKAYWNVSSSWGSGANNTASSSSSLGLVVDNTSINTNNFIDSNGFVNFLASADAARTTDSTYLILTAHGLSNLDIIENTTRNAMSVINAYATPTNGISCTASITGQAVGDSIDKFHLTINKSAETGTTDTVIKITNHGLSNTHAHYISNGTRSWMKAKVTVTDANTLTLVSGVTYANASITGQTTNDVIYFYPYLSTQIAEGLTNNTFLGLNAHGLVNGDLIENASRSNTYKVATVLNSNSITHTSISGQVSGDTINKFHKITGYSATTGTTTTNLVITAHGLSTGDYIYNNTHVGWSKVTVVDANTLTCQTAITGQVSGDSFNLFHYYGQQTANDIVIPSTIYTDYVNLQINFTDTSSGSDEQGGIVLDGIDDYCSLSVPLNLNSSGTLITTFKTSKTGATQGIVGNNNFSSDINGYMLYVSSDNYFRIELCNATTKQVLASNAIVTDGNKHFGAVTWDSSNVNLYLDGVQKQVAQTIIPTNATYNVAVGKGNNYSSQFSGLIKNVLVFNRSLSQQEINQMYNALR